MCFKNISCNLMFFLKSGLSNPILMLIVMLSSASKYIFRNRTFSLMGKTSCLLSLHLILLAISSYVATLDFLYSALLFFSMHVAKPIRRGIISTFHKIRAF